MRITIVGGGNIGTQFAVHCAECGNEVTIFTSNPDLFEKHLSIVDENGVITHEGEIVLATNDPIAGFSKAELIIVTLPANMMKKCAETIYNYTSANTLIGVVPGNGGSECAFRNCIERGNTFFLMERVPAIARLVEKGKCVKSIGYRRELHISALPVNKSIDCSILIQNIFKIPCVSISGILNLTLTPSNPILHTTRLKTIFKDYKNNYFYKSIPLFYEDWDDASSELLLKCDEEVQSICKALPELGLSHVVSLKDYYDSPSVGALTRKISNIPAFKGITTPSIRVDLGFIPDLHSRYFTADFSYGLSLIQQIGVFAEVSTPSIDETMSWYKSISIENNAFQYSDYGIFDRKSFVEFYSK